jgi:hypothetical protein
MSSVSAFFMNRDYSRVEAAADTKKQKKKEKQELQERQYNLKC